MELGSIFLLLAILVIVGLFVTRPLFEKESSIPDSVVAQAENLRSPLMAERDRILNALRELDFDYDFGKIPEEDYIPQRALLLKKGAEVFRKLDSLHRETGRAEESAIPEQPATLQLPIPPPPNASKQLPLVHGVHAANGASDDDLEVMLANRRRARKEKAAGFCPKCGSPVQKSDSFCPKCGTRIR